MANGLPDQIELEVVTPERLLFSGTVKEVTLPGIRGYLGILPGHAPLLSELQVGVISYRQEDRTDYLFCSWGFVEVLPNRVSILAEAAEPPDRIDVEEARAEKERAERLLRSEDPETNYAEAMEIWRVAAAKLEVVERAEK